MTDRAAAVRRLAAGGFVAAAAEVEQLSATADRRGEALDGLVARRQVGEPLAWITDRGVGADLLATAAPDLAEDVRRAASWTTLDTMTTPMPSAPTALATLQRLADWLSHR